MTVTQQASRKPVHLLWTSGWDSTFRLLQLVLTHKYPVRPFYVLDPARLSMTTEVRTIERIKDALLAEHPECKDLLSPTHFALKSDIPPNAAISTAIAALRAKNGIGDQYDCLARFAAQFDEPLELSIERYIGRGDKWRKMLSEHVTKKESAAGAYFQLTSPVDRELEVLSVFRFPLFEYTKLDMQTIAQEQGYANLLELTWFCHKPMTDGSACGTCAPCCTTREDGLGRRIPMRGNLRDKRNTLLRMIAKPFRGAAQ
jgi:hypothetical protein